MTKAYVRKLSYDEVSLENFVTLLTDNEEIAGQAERQYLLEYPTVYIIHAPERNKYNIYIGETNSIGARTKQHMVGDARVKEFWREYMENRNSEMLVIGHTLFNKSLTLDTENRLLQYLTSIPAVNRVYNGRTNPQNNYYTREEFDEVFRQIWRALRVHNKELFPTESVIRDSALFKASPFHKLNEEQIAAKELISVEILQALQERQQGKLIRVEGAAGAGKTVLLSSVFFDLFQGRTTVEEPFDYQDLDAYLIVNHDEQVVVYQEIARKLGLENSKDNVRVLKPTKFINDRDENDVVDVVLIDEAHLLWTQGKQSYKGKNQLQDILDRARVVVAVYDTQQAIGTNQYLDSRMREILYSDTAQVIKLEQQMRISASAEMNHWIRELVDAREVHPIPGDDTYDLKIFDDVSEMIAQIRSRAKDETRGLSRVLATFDWEFVSNRDGPVDGKWMVTVDRVEMPWNRQIEVDRSMSMQNKSLAWAEQPQTIDEVGSMFTIQGFDLNYAGVIIGPSVKFRDGRIVFDKEASCNRHATQKRTMSDGSKMSVAEELLSNQLNILLTRGVHGLYIYAVDEQLREALLAAQRGQSLSV